MPKKHNILLIICDALRPDFLGCYTKAEANTPTIDNLAENSVLFQNAIAPGCGTPLSVPELLTSTYPSIHGDYFLTSPENKLSGLLQANGWDTAAISTNAYLSPIFGYNRGYNHFQYLSKRNEIYLLYYFYRRLIELKDALSKKGFSKLLEFLITLLPLPQVRPPYASAAEVTKKAITWLNKLSEPFFLWLHYMDPHGPYVPPLSSLLHTKRKRGEKRWKWIYRAEIQFLDANLGKLIQYLRSRDFWSNTSLILTADHGEEFGEHGFSGHPHELYDTLIHVPLMIYSPFVKEAGMTIEQPVSLLDIFPTVCDLVGIEKPSHLQGKSLSPFLIEKPKKRDEGVISEAFKKEYEGSMNVGKHECTISDLGKVSYRTKRWKYIYSLNGRDELYNIKNDPMEQNNLIEEEKAIARKFRKRLREHISKQRTIKRKTLKRKLRKRISETREKIF